jgi:hypothetical protein
MNAQPLAGVSVLLVEDNTDGREILEAFLRFAGAPSCHCGRHAGPRCAPRQSSRARPADPPARPSPESLPPRNCRGRFSRVLNRSHRTAARHFLRERSRDQQRTVRAGRAGPTSSELLEQVEQTLAENAVFAERLHRHESISANRRFPTGCRPSGWGLNRSIFARSRACRRPERRPESVV